MSNLLGHPQPSGQGRPVFRFGTVTSASPLRVTMDGPLETQLGATPVTLVQGLTVGTRVQVLIQHGQMVIVGRVGGDRPVQSWTSSDATWTNLGLASASRVLATINIPAAPYARIIDADAIAVWQSVAVGSVVGKISARVNLSVHQNLVANAQVRIPITQTQYMNDYWKSTPLTLHGYLLPANTATTVRLWHWNDQSETYNWRYDRGASGDTSQLFATARPA